MNLVDGPLHVEFVKQKTVGVVELELPLRVTFAVLRAKPTSMSS